MQTRLGDRALEWARWGGLVLCLATGLVSFTDDAATGVSGALPRAAVLVLAAFYGGLLFTLIRPAREDLPGPRVRLAALMVLSLFLDSENLAVLNLFALPFVVRTGRKPWLCAQGAVYAVQLAISWLSLADPVHRAGLARLLREQPAALLAPLASGLFQMIAWGAFAYLLGSLLVQLHADRRELAQANAELRGAQTMLAEAARVEERLRISRELHDSVGHYLTSLGLQLQILDSVAGPDCRRPLERSQLLVRLLLAEVRDAAGSWRGERSAALSVAIRQLLAAAEELQVELDLEPDLPSAHPGTTHTLYRCVQEALTNVLRHASARSLYVSLKHADGAFQLAVRDDGVGRAQIVRGGGLHGMEERVRALGGELRVATSPGQGFALHVAVPSGKSAGRSAA